MDWTDPTGAVHTTLPVDHLGTTLPQPGPETSSLDTNLDDAVWEGEYWDPAAYTGGTALWLRDELDLAAGFRDLDKRQQSPYRYGLSLPTSLRQTLEAEFGWTRALSWEGQVERLASHIHWFGT